MKNVSVNGAARSIGDEVTVARLVRETTGPLPGGATASGGEGADPTVSLNGQVIPRDAWDQTSVPPGADVEILPTGPQTGGRR